MNSFVFECKHCGMSIKAGASDNGSEALCPYCGQQIAIPTVKTVNISSVTPRTADTKIIYADDKPKGEEKRSKRNWKLIAALVFFVVGPLTAFFIVDREFDKENAERETIAKKQLEQAERRAARRSARRAVSTPRQVASSPKAPEQKRIEVAKTSEAERREVAARSEKEVVQRKRNRRTSAVRKTAKITSVMAQNPDELYRKFMKNSSRRIEELRSRMETLPPERQKYCQKLINKIEHLQRFWQARLKYIEQRNKKIAAAAARSYDEQLGREVQQRFEAYTGAKNDWGYNSRCVEYSKNLLTDLKNPRLDPNIRLTDKRYDRCSGNALKAVSSGRIVSAESLWDALCKRYADPECLKDEKRLFSNTLTEYGLPREIVQYNFEQRLQSSKKDREWAKLLEILLCDGAVPAPKHLSRAVIIGESDAAILLLAIGVDPNGVDENGETALFNTYRSSGKGYDIRQILLAAGADPEFRNPDGKRAEDMAFYGKFISAWNRNDLEAAEKYFKQGIDVNMILPSGETLLFASCSESNLEKVEFLIRHGVDTNKKGNMRNTPLAKALSSCLRYYGRKNDAESSFKICKLLLENGADCRVNPVGYGGVNLFYYVISRYSKSQPRYNEIFALFLKHCSNFSEKDWERALSGVSKLPGELVKMLFGYVPADVFENQVVRIFCNRFNKPTSELVDILAEKGIDFNKVRQGHCYMPNGRYVSVKAPLLYLAVRNGQSAAVIKALIRHGANVNWTDKDGQSAADYAQNDEIKGLLE